MINPPMTTVATANDQLAAISEAGDVPLATVNVLDTATLARHEFRLDLDENRDEIQLGSPRFRRTRDYDEEHEDGHVGDVSGD